MLFIKGIGAGKWNRPKRLCIVLTAGVTFGFYKKFIPYFVERGWDITAVSAADENAHAQVAKWGAKTVIMPFVRQPSPFKDLWCLARLWWFFLRHRFEVIQISSPKATLLGAVAAALAGQRIVLSVIGRSYENYTGWKRKLFVLLDKIPYFLADRITTESASLMEAILTDGCCRRERIVAETYFEIDEAFFDESLIEQKQVRAFRSQLGIRDGHLVFLYVGRINRDKGIVELVRAFIQLNCEHAHLVLIGSKDDEANLIPFEIWKTIEENPRIHSPGSLTDPRVAYAACDVFVCPTYRESLSIVVLEASLMKRPVITTDAIGAIDSLIDGVTGILVPKMTEQPLVDAMRRLAGDPELRNRMGCAGREWVIEQFGNHLPTRRAFAFFEDIVN